MNENSKYKVNGYKLMVNRTPLHMQKALDIIKEDGWTYYIAQDDPGNVNRMLRAGWVHAPKGCNASDLHVQNGTHTGDVEVITTNRRPGAISSTAYVMRIPTELYEQDQIARTNLNSQIMSGIDPEKNRGIYGSEGGSFKKETLTSAQQFYSKQGK